MKAARPLRPYIQERLDAGKELPVVVRKPLSENSRKKRTEKEHEQREVLEETAEFVVGGMDEDVFVALMEMMKW